MKKQTIIILLLLMVVLPAVMPAATVWDDVKDPVTQLLSIVLTVFGVPLLIKLGRKWGLDISDTQANAAIDSLMNIVINIDLEHPDADSMAKKKLSVYEAQQTLPAAKQELLIKKYGSLDAAVQVAFERSSLNKKAVVK